MAYLMPERVVHHSFSIMSEPSLQLHESLFSFSGSAYTCIWDSKRNCLRGLKVVVGGFCKSCKNQYWRKACKPFLDKLVSTFLVQFKFVRLLWHFVCAIVITAIVLWPYTERAGQYAPHSPTTQYHFSRAWKSKDDGGNLRNSPFKKEILQETVISLQVPFNSSVLLM